MDNKNLQEAFIKNLNEILTDIDFAKLDARIDHDLKTSDAVSFDFSDSAKGLIQIRKIHFLHKEFEKISDVKLVNGNILEFTLNDKKKLYGRCPAIC
ncbi:hypothetical protein AALB39_16490 [Lachnospiraceae bacterium 54-53]